MTPQRNKKYLAFVRSLPCAVCGSQRHIEAAHTGPHGMGQKSSDLAAIPLCTNHHRTGPQSYHKLGPQRFAQLHGLDSAALVARLNRLGLDPAGAHSFSKREPSPGFTRFHCTCSYRTAWYRLEADARAALHNHMDSQGSEIADPAEISISQTLGSVA